MSEDTDTGATGAAPDGPTPEERAAKAERELAMVRAGIDTTSGMGRFFAEHYTGEATVEAVKAAALEAGALVESPAVDEPPVFEEEEAAQTGVRRAASTGAAGPDPAEHPAALAKRAFADAVRDGTREDGMVAAIRAKATAVQSGDRRAAVAVRR